MKHGVLSTYTNKKCRCDECKQVARGYRVAYFLKMKGSIKPELCMFGGCENHRHYNSKNFCLYHDGFLYRLIKDGVRTKDEVFSLALKSSTLP